VCAPFDMPDTPSCCTGCGSSHSASCQANGCWGGWACKRDTCKCAAAPAVCVAGPTGSTGTPAPTGVPGPTGTPGPIGIYGGTSTTLHFAIIGDTRPPVIDDTSAYPSAIITKIYQDIQAENPDFALTTGDYIFSKPAGTTSGPQFDMYLSARSHFSGTVFFTMGNHECTGSATSLCGPGLIDGETNNFINFKAKLLSTIARTDPYYDVRINAADGTWSAKFVFVAANAWSTAQAAWMTKAMAVPSTYTFVVRHESMTVTGSGVSGSNAIMAQYPYTTLLAGHTHTFKYDTSHREIITGIGGAPLVDAVNYGYVVGERRTDGAIAFKLIDYSTRAVVQSFAMKADGTPTP
jgi:hypothetical protein